MNAREYIEQLAQAAGLSDDEKAGILKVAANDKFAKGIEEGVMLRSDYSRNLDQMNANLKAQTEKNTNYYNQLLTWEQQKQAEYSQPSSGQVVNGEYLTKKEVNDLLEGQKAAMKQQEQSFITIAKMMGRLASQHAVEFKEPLDTDALEKVAIEKQLPLPQAYDQMVSARRAETQTVTRKAEIDKAVADGVREYASTHHIPLDSTPRESQYGRLTLDRPTDKSAVPDYQPNSGRLSPQGERTLREGFLEEWNKAGTAPQ